MHNSINALILSSLIALIAVTLLIRVKDVTNNIDLVGNRLSSVTPNTKQIETLKNYINSVTTPEQIMNEEFTINFYDISSKIDINFIDSTIFKKPLFKRLLKNGVSYNDFEIYRDKIGFTSNIDKYKEIFSRDFQYNLFFTAYSLPNINNISDIILKKYLLLYSQDSNKIEDIIKWVQKCREDHIKITTKELSTYSLGNDNNLGDILTTIPNWNINNITPQMLELSRNISEYSEELYLGERTTFWLVTLEEVKKKNLTKIIFKWSESTRTYNIISIKAGINESN